MPVPAGAWLYSHKTGRIEVMHDGIDDCCVGCAKDVAECECDKVAALEAEVARLRGLLKEAAYSIEWFASADMTPLEKRDMNNDLAKFRKEAECD